MPARTHRAGLIVVAMLTAASGMAVTSAAATVGTARAAGTSWKLQRSPNAALPGGQIDSVSCSSAHACTAVGTNINTSGLNVTLAERWNGVSWQREATPNPAGETTASDSPVLLGVSCAKPHFCEAVGTYTKDFTETILADVWEGRSWKTQSVPTPPGTTSVGLNAVSCTSAKSCEAVGFYIDNSGESILADGWNGRSWHLQSVPRQSGSTLNRLVGISCVSATSCQAVGSYDDGSGNTFGLAASWNGASWQLRTMPVSVLPDSVSCASATFCEAVGPGVAARWNGTSWRAQSFPVPNGASFVNVGGASCVSAISCEAVGSYQVTSSTNYVTLAASWDGTSWTLQAAPSLAGTMFAGLNAVSCVTAGVCEAGGYFQLQITGSIPAPTVRALVEIWNGSSWQLQHAAQPASATTNSLSSVSCVSASSCEAVGSHVDGSGSLVGLAEVWNGAGWRIQKTPDPGQGQSTIHLSLNAVSCVSVRFCIAAGESSAAQPVETEVWNGSSWQPQPFPHPVHLTSVSCTSVDFCMAVGGTFAFSWNGTSWSALPTSLTFQFSSVSCASARFCEATGADSVTGDRAEVWNGSSWSPQPTPAPTAAFGITLNSVACKRPNYCEAVGNYLARSTGNTVALAEVWKGVKWVVQSIPKPNASQGSSLLGVSCLSATFCAAVGWNNASTGSPTLVLVWNGTAWSLRATPNVLIARAGSLLGVSCGASNACEAVGGASFPQLGFGSTFVEAGG
jgi:hypothetical protein